MSRTCHASPVLCPPLQAIPFQGVHPQAAPIQAVAPQAIPIQAVPLSAVPLQAAHPPSRPPQAAPPQDAPLNAVQPRAIPLQLFPFQDALLQAVLFHAVAHQADARLWPMRQSGQPSTTGAVMTGVWQLATAAAGHGPPVSDAGRGHRNALQAVGRQVPPRHARARPRVGGGRVRPRGRVRTRTRDRPGRPGHSAECGTTRPRGHFGRQGLFCLGDRTAVFSPCYTHPFLALHFTSHSLAPFGPVLRKTGEGLRHGHASESTAVRKKEACKTGIHTIQQSNFI